MTLIKTKVLNYIQANPGAKPKAIAAALGLRLRQVYNVRFRYKLSNRHQDSKA
jgi:hypothetical protein